ncbi:ABC transporter ATP-binding protein [Ruminococcus sp. OA3]|uniref:ABC transporter ATP-binding protein n=1 Tax=Ruminococcus sp. OA3 TaxID=2914164 RepID=UPI001F069BF5|nr:ABC transporter ATP-binding protein [Ruminococcus sp. OA3]MCH1981351.1 ABC transporter ATP-binding protein [Ruminococcus sp. OA3]
MSVNPAKDFSKNSNGVILKNITKKFVSHDNNQEFFTAVDNVDLEIKDGEMVTLLGPSGCGKTTTLRMISGFEIPTSGEIFIGDRPVANVPPNKRDISMVFQSYALFPHMKVYNNICYGLKVKKVPKTEIARRMEKILDLMQIKELADRYPNQLSGGQQQRVALARAVVIEPSVLLFDEPLSNLDAKLRETMRDELRAIQKRLGITSLYVTHDQAEAMAISDKVVIMKDGVISQVGTPQEIYEYPQDSFVANFIGKANYIPCILKSRDADGSAHVKIGEIPCTIPNPGAMKNVEDGKECLLSVRPESVRLVDGGRGPITGNIIRITYFGYKVEYVVDISGNTVTVELYNPQLAKSFDDGQEVTLDLDLECIRIVK